MDDAYATCSECGYESVCTYDSCSNCSCRIKIPPPKEYQAGPVHSPTHGPFAQSRVGTLQKKSKSHLALPSTETEDTEIYCDCDADSCLSSEKCYCSLRGHPDHSQDKQHPQQRRPALLPPPAVAHKLANNTTIIHCNGPDGTNTIRSTSSSNSYSSCSTCLHHSCDTGSTATDTTCYSIHMQQQQQQQHHIQMHQQQQHSSHSSVSSLLSGCESPQTAWRRNSRLHEEQQQRHKNQHQHQQQQRLSLIHI